MPEAGEVLPGGRGELRRCVEQPRADLGQERADLQSAVGLGGGEARRAGRGGGLLDLPGAGGSEGPVHADCAFFWGVWKFSQNKTAGKELIAYLMEREQVEERCNGGGYDLPPFASMVDFKVWETVEPPKGTVYNYPIRPWHNAKPSLDGVGGVARRRGAGLQSRHPQSDDGAAQGGSVDQAGDRLGQG